MPENIPDPKWVVGVGRTDSSRYRSREESGHITVGSRAKMGPWYFRLCGYLPLFKKLNIVLCNYESESRSVVSDSLLPRGL